MFPVPACRALDVDAETKGGVVIDARAGIRFYVETPLRDRLAALQLTPADVRYVAFSHMHTDHAGNANLFPTATHAWPPREVPPFPAFLE